MGDEKTQADKFRQAARELEADDDEGRFSSLLKKVVKQKPKDTESSDD